MALNSTARSLSRFTQRLAQLVGSSIPPASTPWTARQRYEMMDNYYYANGVYTALMESLRAADVHVHAITEIRNPVAAAVEFYAAKLWPGPLETALQIKPAEPARADLLTEAINRVWDWSNWAAKKQLAARWLPLHGDLFLHARQKVKRRGTGTDGAPLYEITGAYIQVVDAKEVTDFREDERGFITLLRHDVSNTDDRGYTTYTVTVWSKDAGDVKTYRHTQAIDTPLSHMGDPVSIVPFAAQGIDFIPWAHCPFRDVGPEDEVPRGLPLIWTAISKIDACNRNATRLNDLMLRHGKPTNALKSNMIDATGRPIAVNLEIQEDSNGVKTWGDDDVLNLPGNAELQQLVPNINYQAHLDLVTADLRAIEMDLPELTYHRIMDKGEMSGKALQRVLSVLVDRVVEVRGNAYPTLIRATQMALTLAQVGEVKGFDSKALGTYDTGAFAFTLVGQDVIPQTEEERGATAAVYVGMGVPVDMALERYAGWSADDAAKVAQSRAAATAQQQAPAAQGDAGRARAVEAAKALTPAQQAARKAAAIDKAVPAAEATIAGLLTERKPPATPAQIEAGLDAVKRAQARQES